MESLIAAARLGSLPALGALLENCRRYLLLIANRDLGADLRARVAPSDFVQEALIDAARGFDQFQGATPTEFRAWIGMILQHRMIEQARSHRCSRRDVSRERPDPDGERLGREAGPAPPPFETLIRKEAIDALHAALAQLSEDHRRVIRLRSIERRPWEEVGRILGGSPDGSRKLFARAVERLQTLMGTGRDDDPGAR